MSTLKAHNIEPATGTDVALGAAGDSITISGDSLKLNTFKEQNLLEHSEQFKNRL